MTRDPHDWWQTAPAEEHLADLPVFDTMMDRARYMVDAMCRAANPPSPDAKVFVYQDQLCSQNDLIAMMVELEADAMYGGWLLD